MLFSQLTSLGAKYYPANSYCFAKSRPSFLRSSWKPPNNGRTAEHPAAQLSMLLLEPICRAIHVSISPGMKNKPNNSATCWSLQDWKGLQTPGVRLSLSLWKMTVRCLTQVDEPVILQSRLLERPCNCSLRERIKLRVLQNEGQLDLQSYKTASGS
jgi:hypothetical protein